MPSVAWTQMIYWFLCAGAGATVGYWINVYLHKRRVKRMYEARQNAEMVLQDMERSERRGLALFSYEGKQLPRFEIDLLEPREENRDRLREHLERHAPGMGPELIEEMVDVLDYHITEVTVIEELHRELDEIEPEDFGDMGR